MVEPCPVLCVGNTNYDISLRVDGIPEPDKSKNVLVRHEGVGGAAANTAQALSDLGQDIHLVTGFAKDRRGKQIQMKLEEKNISTHRVDDEQTTTITAVSTSLDSPPMYMAEADDIADYTMDDIPQSVWEESEHVHLTSYSEEANEIAKLVGQSKKTLSFTPTQGYVDTMFGDVVKNANLIFMNSEEAEILRDRHHFGSVAESTTVVVTQGSMGSSVYASDAITTHPGFNVDRPETSDTVGAGDAFSAGFIYSWLNDCSYESCLETANATGAYAVKQTGAPDSIDMSFVNSLTS